MRWLWPECRAEISPTCSGTYVENTQLLLIGASHKFHNAWLPCFFSYKACTQTLREWTNGKRSLNVGIPMVWCEPTYVTDCYFWAVDVIGINRKNRGSLKYTDLQSARRSVGHCDEIPMPVFGELPDISDEDAVSLGGHEDEEEGFLEDNTPHPFSKVFNGLCRTVCIQIEGKTPSSLTVLASASSVTGIKSTSVFSIQWRTCCMVQIFHSFYSSLECHRTNPKIGDC